MDFKMHNVFSVTKGERIYTFDAPNGSPYGEAIDAIFEILQKIHDMQRSAIDNMKPTAKTDDDAAQPIEATLAN